MEFKGRHQKSTRTKALDKVVLPLLSVLLTTIVVLTSPVQLVMGEDGAQATAEATIQPTPVPTDVMTEPATVEPPSETAMPVATEVPAESETPTATDEQPTFDATVTPEATETAISGTGTPVLATATSTPSPVAVLGYTYAKEPDCKTQGDQPEVVRSDAWLVYECSYEIQVSGERLSPDDVKLGWTVKATAGEGWSVQLLPQVTAANADPTWTTETLVPVELTEPDGAVSEATMDESGAFTAKRMVRFDLRVRRVGCLASANPVELLVTVNPTLRGIDGQVVDKTDLVLKPFALKPEVTAYSEPVISFNGPLDFGSVGVDAEGVEQSYQSAIVALTISDLDVACGKWTVSIGAESLVSSNGSIVPSSNLRLVSIDGVALPEGGCDLDAGCVISTVAAPDANITVTYLLGISLTIPDQAQTGAFGSSLWAAMRSSEVTGEGS